MKNKIWQLKITDQFSSAHALRHYQGKCENLHGHNYKVEICLEGEQLSSDTELLIDFTVLKKKLKVMLEQLDHQVLNNIHPFNQINPSSERLAQFIWQEFTKILENTPQAKDVRLYSVNVEEKAGQSATYREF